MAALCLAICLGAAGTAVAGVTPVSSFGKRGTDATTGSTAVGGGPAGSTRAGDTIDWVLDYRNRTGASAQVDIRDVISGNQAFVPGSLRVPPGFTPNWSVTGGSAWTTLEPAAGVNAVRATGPSTGGSTGTQTVSQPGPAPFTATGAGGDGYEALFVGNRIYNIHHHAGGGGATQIDCHERTGARCSGAYPRYVSATAGATFGTGGNTLTTALMPAAAVRGTRIFYPVGVIGSLDVGVACADVATQTSCGFTKLGVSSTGANPNNSSAVINGGAVAGDRYYTVGHAGQIFCFDLVSQTACTGFAAGVADPGSGTLRWPYFNLTTFDGRYLFGSFGRATQRDMICIDLTTNARCPGFPIVGYTATAGAGNLHNSTMAPILDASGQVTGICGVSAANTSQHPFKCWDLQGTSVPVPFSTTQTTGTGVNWVNFGEVEAIGSRLYFAESTPQGVATYTCWDYATAAVCANFVKATTGAVTRAYTLRQDAVNPDCIWEVGDAGRFEVFSATFGGTNCSQAQANLELRPADNYCDGQAGHATAWERLTISGVTQSDYTGLAVTITDENGAPVPGWSNRVFNNQTTSIDISGIPYAGSTRYLRFAVSVAGLAANRTATITATYAGDPVQVCFSTRVQPGDCDSAQTLANLATAATNAGISGDDRALPNGSGTVNFTQAPDPSVCRADVGIVKTASPDPPTPGLGMTYRLTVTNHGPDAAQDVVATDPLPSGTSFVSASNGCTEAGGTVSCAAGGLADGESREFEILVRVSPSRTSEITNTARVASAVEDPNPGNDTSTVTTTPAPHADLSIAKTVDDHDPPRDGFVTYTLTVFNLGPSDAVGVSVTDSPDPGVSPRAASPSQGSCPSPSRCELGDLAAGGSAKITITAVAVAEGQAANTATVTSVTPDPDPTDNTARAVIRVHPRADLSISKTASQTSVREGDDFSYTLTVTNLGPSTAEDVTVTDALPPGVTLRSVRSSAGSCQPSKPVLCLLGDLADGATETIVLEVTATDAGRPENTAVVISPTPDPRPANNTDHTTITSEREAELAIDKTASTDAVTSGEAFDWVLEVVNNGPSRSTGTVVTDRVPDGLAVISATSSRGSCTTIGQTVACSLGTLARGDRATITVTVLTARAGSYANTASVTSEVRDPKPENNVDDALVHASAIADVAVAKKASAERASIGDTVTYTVTATNHGPDQAADVTITDPLPANATLVSATPSKGTCQPALGVLVCNLGSLANSEVVTVSIAVTLTEAGDTHNAAQVTSSTPDSNRANDRAESSITAEQADVMVRKDASRQRPPVGGSLTYSIVATNAGPGTARRVVVTDPIPSALQFVEVQTATGACAHVQGAVVCNLGDLAPGQSVTVSVRAIALRVGDAHNTASAVAQTSDPNPQNNVASALVTAPRAPRLALSKSAARSRVRGGGRIRFTLRVRNLGSATARRVRVCDRMPGGLAYVSSSARAAVRAGRYCWSLADIAPGGRRTVRVTTRALRGAVGLRINRARVTSGNARRANAARRIRILPAAQRGGGVTG